MTWMKDVVQDDVDAVGLPAVGKFLAGENDAVTGKSCFQRPLAAVGLPVLNLRGDVGTGVLMQGVLDPVTMFLPSLTPSSRQMSCRLPSLMILGMGRVASSMRRLTTSVSSLYANGPGWPCSLL